MVIRLSWLQKSFAIIPIAKHLSSVCLRNKVLQTTFEFVWLLSRLFNIANPHPYVEIWEFLEKLPSLSVMLYCREYIARNLKLRWQIRKGARASVRHQTEPNKSTSSFLVQFGPIARRIFRNEARSAEPIDPVSNSISSGTFKTCVTKLTEKAPYQGWSEEGCRRNGLNSSWFFYRCSAFVASSTLIVRSSQPMAKRFPTGLNATSRIDSEPKQPRSL